MGQPSLSFDARVIPATPGFAIEYLANRQNEAWRNHINGYCQQALIEEGMSAKKAAEQLKGLPAKDLHEMMHMRGFNLATTPAWQRRGVLVYKKITEKEGFNPITQETVMAERSAVTVESGSAAVHESGREGVSGEGAGRGVRLKPLAPSCAPVSRWETERSMITWNTVNNLEFDHLCLSRT